MIKLFLLGFVMFTCIAFYAYIEAPNYLQRQVIQAVDLPL